MINKVYVGSKNFIKENYKFILSIILMYLVLSFPLPYYIYNGGGIINIEDRIVVEDSSKKQNLNMCYVNQLRGNIATFLMSYIIPGWDLEKINNEEYDFDEELYRNKILLEESINNATINAFKVSNKEYSITSEKVYVSYILDGANTTLKVGDQILKVNDNIIHSMQEYKDIVNNSAIGTKFEIEVLAQDKKEIRSAEVKNIEGQKLTGISVTLNYSIKTDPKVAIKFKGNEAGPSGGLILSLGIYEKINDITLYRGKKICGTGTIDMEGNIGEIGGVKYKLKGAVKNNCDIFLAPSANFKEVKKEKKNNKYDIEIYEAKTLEETINYLMNK